MTAAGILFTLSFLSKYQSLFMIVILVYFICLSQTRQGIFNFKKCKESLLIFLGSIVFSSLAFLLLLLSADSLSKFFSESFLFSMNYATVQGFGGGLSFIEKLSVGWRLLAGQPLIVLAALLLLPVIRNFNFQHFHLHIEGKKIKLSSLMFTSLFLFLFVGFLTISVPGNAFPHYVLFFLWALNIFFLSFNVLDIQKNSKGVASNGFDVSVNKKASSAVLVLIAYLASLSSVTPDFKGTFFSSGPILANETRYRYLSNAEILTFCPKRSQVLIWGWSSELFAYYDWVPVPNVVNDVARIKFSQPSRYQTLSLTAGIKNEETDCVYEAFGANFFGGFSPDQGVSSLPSDDLDFLRKNYTQTMLKDGTSVWSRNR